MSEIAIVVPKPRQRTTLSPFLMGDRVRSLRIDATSRIFEGEIIAVRGANWIVLDATGAAWARLTSELVLLER